MNPVFADSGYWIALLDEQDDLHRRATSWTSRLGSITVITTQLVLVEVLAALGTRGSYLRQLSIAWVKKVEESPGVEIVPMSAEQFTEAYEGYVDRPDQSWSLTDCASFLVMEEHRITEALAYDRDFVQAGFRALLQDDVN